MQSKPGALPLASNSRAEAHFDRSAGNKALAACFMTRGEFLTPICLVWSHLLLKRCEGSRRSTDGWVGCREECELYPAFVLVCIFVHTFGTHACVHVCLHLSLAVVSVSPSAESVGAQLVCQLVRSPLTRRLLGSPGTQTAATAMPSPNSSAKPWTGREEV